MEVVGTAMDGEEAVQLALNLRPDMALIDYDLQGITGTQTCEILNVLAPDVMSVIVADPASPKQVEDCMRFGARAVTCKPPDTDKLLSVISDMGSIRKRRESGDILQWGDISKIPHIISVSGAKGGIGKSTIAVNLAVTLAKDLPEKIAILDFYNQFGDVPTMFNITPKGTIADLAHMCKELDVDVIGNYMTRHPLGVHIITMSVKPIAQDAVPMECMDEILYILKRMYKFIVVDVPASLNTGTMRIFSRSSLVVLVSNLMDLNAVTDAHKLYEALLEEGLSRDVMGIVFNRISRSDSLKANDVRKMFDCRTLAEVPNDDRVTAAINEGTPLVASDPSCRFSKGIGVLAKAIVEPQKQIDGK
jgi:pilus assembly protein CpaE